MPAFAKEATIACSTKRSAVNSNTSKAPTPAPYLANLKCTPLDPVFDDIRERAMVETPYVMLQTFIEGDRDILPGDALVVGGKDYPIKSCVKWDWRGSRYLHLQLEDLKS